MREEDVRTPYRVVVTATYRITDGQPSLLTASVESADPASLVAVRLGERDPVPGWVRADRLISTYRPWLDGPVGALSPETTDLLDAAIRNELDL